MFGALATFFVCTPMKRYWDFSVPGTCINISANFVALAAFNVGTDVVMLLLPIWLLGPLKIQKRQKIGVTLILMIGSFVCIVSILRLAFIFPGLTQMDTTWHYVDNIIWIILEMYVGVICACLPSLKALIKHYFPEFFDGSHVGLGRRIPSFDVATPFPQQREDSSNIFEGQKSTNAGTSVQLKSLATSSEDGACDKRNPVRSSIA